MIELLAALIYGALSILLAAWIAHVEGSTLGLTLAFLSAGAAYVFQCVVVLAPEKEQVLRVCWGASAIFVVASVACSLIFGSF